ncbi:MAG: ATP-binding protein [Methanobrevibacter sp.]|jgi:hypothetical protein|nr:ATP-binding protein [Candidatus Methanoflexus mossambicus]
MDMPKLLPKTISSFKGIRENNYIYVDKTKEIYNLIKPKQKYFLSRPRRFGKTLLINTLKELFEGNKKLFEGLYIYDKWDWDKTYHVLKIDMSGRDVRTPEEFKISLNGFIDVLSDENSIELKFTSLKDKFEELIKKIAIQTGKELVILIDEYDFPIIDNMSNIEVAKENRTTLSDFYQALKTSEEYIHFTFITGVSKFVKTTIFSKLNNLDDITIDSRYSTICGYSKKDLEENFSYYIESLSEKQGDSWDETIAKIKSCYDGYSWDGKHFLYNPTSIISTLNKQKYSNYWFDTGTPTFLMDLVKENKMDIKSLTDSNLYFNGEFPTWDLDDIDFTTALLQTGYLTIKENTKSIIGEEQYNLGIPNKEVKSSLFNYLIAAYTNNTPETMNRIRNNFLSYLIAYDENNLSKTLDMFIGKIPYHSQMDNWKNYQGIFNGFFLGMGLNVQSEEANSQGRIDYILKFKDLCIIVELKYSQQKSFKTMFKEAWSQITKKRYYQKYQDKNLILIAIAIKDGKAKEVQCQIKSLDDLKEQ